MIALSIDKRGLTLVEVVIASAIILTAVVSLLGVHTLYLKTIFAGNNSVQAALLSEEGIEALRFFRDDSWSAKITPLVNGTAYGLVYNNGWQASTTNTYVERFKRTITLSPVYRDASLDIVASGGSLDPDTRLITSSVAWPVRDATTTKTIYFYLTNLYSN